MSERDKDQRQRQLQEASYHAEGISCVSRKEGGVSSRRVKLTGFHAASFMTYLTTINRQTYAIDTGPNEQQDSITLDGSEHRIDWQRIAALVSNSNEAGGAGGHYSLIIAGQSYDIFARSIKKAGKKSGQAYEIQVAGQRFEVDVEDERTSKLAGLVRAGTLTGEATIQAPMPGLVVNILVEQGAEVAEGQAVIILEAMKMENDLLAPIGGIVKEVLVSKSQAVDQGQVLVTITAHQ